jgi:hypothetical protein
MIDLLRFLGGLVSAALQWLAGLTCMSPILLLVGLLAFSESGRSSKYLDMLLLGFLLLGYFIVWFVGYVMRQIAPRLSQSEPFGYGQTTIGAILCFLGIAESIRASSLGLESIYPTLVLLIPGLVLLLAGIRVVMIAYFAGE